jgi:hypothetical protein
VDDGFVGRSPDGVVWLSWTNGAIISADGGITANYF